jgi:hypothetical protein
VTDPEVSFLLSSYKSQAVIGRINGFWPTAAKLYPWIHSTWTKNYEVTFCSKGFFIVLFQDIKDYYIESYQRDIGSGEE